MENRIVQIVAAAPGWQAVFIDEGAELVPEPVSCWGLVEGLDGREIRPLIACGISVEDAASAGNFVGVLAPGQKPESLREIADTIRKRNGHGKALER
jgi:hypothetical protein